MTASTNATGADLRALRLMRFLRKPWREQASSLRARWTKATSNIPVPVRLPFGALWLARNDHIGKPAREGQFENAEMAFVERHLRPAMTVLDIGAHHGLYTLLASKRVGPRGRVISFEPSPRERKALRLHLILNRCRNVDVQGLALSNEETQSDLYLVEAWAAGCNSLRPPDVPATTTPIRVQVTGLDSWLYSHKMDHVDFIKLDVEGGELSVLKGAEKLLSRRPRPIILAEVQDIRTRPWGYRAKDIIEHLIPRGFAWFRITETGCLEQLDATTDNFDGNFVAWPEERTDLLVPARGLDVSDATSAVKI